MLQFLHAWRRIKVSPVLHSARTLRVRQHLTVRMQNRAFCLEIMQEVWKAIPGYEGQYEVSDQGNVRNAKLHILAPNKMTNGYLCVHLYLSGKHTRSPKTIHRLVATVFLPNPENCGQVNHKNFDRCDNRVGNLEWVTSYDNVHYSISAGRYTKVIAPIKGTHVENKSCVVFETQVAAEEALRGRRTGRLSAAMKAKCAAYGYMWEYA